MGVGKMSLVVDLRITRTDGTLEPIERMVIQRLEPLTDTDAFHKYEASIPSQSPVQFNHRYSDGAWRCVMIALEALAV